jgi:PadR family transcriptional regulator PadR
LSGIKERSGDVLRVDEGSLYPSLHRMEEAGWIKGEWVSKDPGRRLRVYRLTAEGGNSLLAWNRAGKP